MKRLGVILIMIVVSLPIVSYGTTLSALGTATVDGVMSPGEWDNAAKIDFQANVPPCDGGGTTPATLYVMNDGTNLYVAVKVARSSFGSATRFTADFDNNNVSIPKDGDDVIAMYVGISTPPSFMDLYRYTCPDSPDSAGCLAQDTDPTGGILPEAKFDDVVTSASNDGSVTIIEMSHKLKSGDSLHDFSLDPGSTVGLHATLSLFSIARCSSRSAQPNADTEIPASGSGSNYEQVKIASQVMRADIDIKPGSKVNSINSGSEGKIPVAIVSTPDFNAPALVDRSSLTFGRTGDEQSLAFCNAGSEDVNGDRIPDLICHFNTKLTGFQLGDESGILKGRTTDRTMFKASDSVRIVH